MRFVVERIEPRDDVLRALGRARLVARGHAKVNLVAGKAYLDLLGTSSAPFGRVEDGRPDGALPALREAGTIEPKAFAAAWGLGLEHGFSLEDLRAITPERTYARIILFDYLRHIGRPDEAIDLMNVQLTREPWNIEVTTRLALAYREAGRETEGRAYFDSLAAKWE